jgi:hypothetical protein
LFFVFRDLDLDRLLGVLRRGEGAWIAVLVGSVPLEQVVRGWKWRQLLFEVRPVGTFRLFGAVMAGYFANMVVPIGISAFVRAWLVARLEGLRVSTVLLTTAVERFVDGVVFAVGVGVLVVFAALPDAEGNLRLALVAAGLGGLVLFAGLLAGLFVVKGLVVRPGTVLGGGIARLERAFGGRLAGLGEGIAAGIVWPAARWRASAVVGASVAMKLVSATHFLWAGLAVGVLLTPSDYLFLLVFAGYSLFITRIIRVPGGFLVGSAFALKLLGVAEEEALAMVMSVYVASIVTTVSIGAPALWRSGVTLVELRTKLRPGGD